MQRDRAGKSGGNGEAADRRSSAVRAVVFFFARLSRLNSLHPRFGREKGSPFRRPIWGEMPMLKNDPKETAEKWCQNILHVCYIAIGINAAVLVVIWLLYMARTREPVSPGYYWGRFIAAPTLCMLALNFCADRLIRARRVTLKAKKYLALCISLVFCAFLCMVHSILAVLLVTFVIPVFLSTIFADCKITRHIFILSLAAQILSGIKMRFASTRDFGPWIWVELIVASAILVASYFFAEALIQEGQYNIRSLNRSVQEREQLEKRLQKDGCTGLYSHASFEKLGRDTLAECLAWRVPLSFSMVDLDNFKEINDTYGHTAGDKVLRHLSQILLNNSNGNILAFRLGGDEFGLLMKGFALPNAQNVCAGIQSLFASSPLSEVDYRKVTFSCGIASLAEPETRDLTHLYEAADAAMYKAKRNGKNRTELWKTAGSR